MKKYNFDIHLKRISLSNVQIKNGRKAQKKDDT